MKQTPVYMIIALEVQDMQTFFVDYVTPLQAHHERHGVETLVATPNPEILEGSYSKSLTVVLKFPSAKAQRDWYSDPEYQPLLQRRFDLTNTENSWALVVPEFQSAAKEAADE